jgi:hypothetical protein
LVAQAHQQVAKNAWYFDDDGAALSQMDEAITAARQALAIDPHSADAAHLVADLERRLAKADPARQSSN